MEKPLAPTAPGALRGSWTWPLSLAVPVEAAVSGDSSAQLDGSEGPQGSRKATARGRDEGAASLDPWCSPQACPSSMIQRQGTLDDGPTNFLRKTEVLVGQQLAALHGLGCRPLSIERKEGSKHMAHIKARRIVGCASPLIPGYIYMPLHADLGPREGKAQYGGRQKAILPQPVPIPGITREQNMVSHKRRKKGAARDSTRKDSFGLMLPTRLSLLPIAKDVTTTAASSMMKDASRSSSPPHP